MSEKVQPAANAVAGGGMTKSKMWHGEGKKKQDRRGKDG